MVQPRGLFVRSFGATRRLDPGFGSEPTAVLRFLEGRDFASSDGEDGPPVAIVNRAMAERFWPDGSALGHTLTIEVPGWDDPTVVGVVADAKIHSLGEPPTPFLYLPYSQEYSATVSVLAVADDAGATANALYRLVRERHPDVIVNASTTLEDHIGVTLVVGRLSALLSSVFAVIALGLSIVGLYGVVSYAVTRRVREIGIRLALGASPEGVVTLQVRDGMRLVLMGGGAGLILALLATRALSIRRPRHNRRASSVGVTNHDFPDGRPTRWRVSCWCETRHGF